MPDSAIRRWRGQSPLGMARARNRPFVAATFYLPRAPSPTTLHISRPLNIIYLSALFMDALGRGHDFFKGPNIAAAPVNSNISGAQAVPGVPSRLCIVTQNYRRSRR